MCLAAPVFAAKQRITIAGSSTVAPLALEIAKRYESENPKVRIDVQTGGSTRGINDARNKLIDVGMVSRALSERESDLLPFLIALDGIGMVVHHNNPVTTVTPEQVRAIFTGQILNWQALGGHDQPITVVNKAEGRSTLELFLKHFQLKNSKIKAHAVIGDNQQGIKTISGNPGAIGYVSIGAAEYEVSRGTPIKVLPLSGQPARVETVRSGAYPLSRQLNFVIAKQPNEWVRRFLVYAQSPAVADLIEAQFFVKP